MISGIYKLTFSNRSTYIGKSIDIERRLIEHTESMKKGIGAKKIQDAFILAGLPTSEILIKCHPDHIDLMESAYIIFQRPNLNSNTPIKLNADEIDILRLNARALMSSTATHVKSLMLLDTDLEEYKDRTKELEKQVEELTATKTKKEIRIEIGRKMHRLQQNYDTLVINNRLLTNERDSLLYRRNLPWYRKLFERN